MYAFINSIDVLGDDIVTDKLLDRTIAEYCDDTVLTVGYDAFHNCSALASISLPNATEIFSNAFEECSALTSANFQALTSIGQSAFLKCSTLTAVLLRNTAQLVRLANRNAFTSTPIASGTGYIYVPAALIDSYKTATNWSTYANQIRAIEDYTVDGTVTGEVDTTRCMVRFFNDDGTLLGYKVIPYGDSATYDGDEPVKEGDYTFLGWNPEPINVTADMDCYAKFKDNSIYTWPAVSAAIADGTYKDLYAIGDLVPIDLGSYGVKNMQIVAFDADDKADGSGKAAISWVSENLITLHTVVDSATQTNNWDGTVMRSWLQGDFYAVLPEDVKTSIVPVNKTYYDRTSGATKSCTDNVWIPSYREIFGDSGNKIYCETDGTDYTGYFNSDSARIKRNLDSGRNYIWWLRTADNNSGYFRSVKSNGTSNFGNGMWENGVVIGFCT